MSNAFAVQNFKKKTDTARYYKMHAGAGAFRIVDFIHNGNATKKKNEINATRNCYDTNALRRGSWRLSETNAVDEQWMCHAFPASAIEILFQHTKFPFVCCVNCLLYGILSAGCMHVTKGLTLSLAHTAMLRKNKFIFCRFRFISIVVVCETNNKLKNNKFVICIIIRHSID